MNAINVVSLLENNSPVTTEAKETMTKALATTYWWNIFVSRTKTRSKVNRCDFALLNLYFVIEQLQGKSLTYLRPKLVKDDCRLLLSNYSIFRHDFVYLFSMILCITSETVFISTYNWPFFEVVVAMEVLNEYVFFRTEV